MKSLMPQLYVSDMKKEYCFISNYQDVQPIKEYIGKNADEFDSFFAEIENGDYKTLFGMKGIVPLNSKPVWCLICNGKDATI